MRGNEAHKSHGSPDVSKDHVQPLLCTPQQRQRERERERESSCVFVRCIIRGRTEKSAPPPHQLGPENRDPGGETRGGWSSVLHLTLGLPWIGGVEGSAAHVRCPSAGLPVSTAAVEQAAVEKEREGDCWSSAVQPTGHKPPLRPSLASGPHAVRRT